MLSELEQVELAQRAVLVLEELQIMELQDQVRANNIKKCYITAISINDLVFVM